jgi:DNA-binding MarR family transcriptional regulator
MSDLPRHVRIQQEKGKALARAVHASELQVAGDKRELALHEADVQLDRIAQLLPNALQAGLNIAEIARITRVSRPTLYELKARYGEGDISLAVLQSVASRTPITPTELAECLGRDEREVTKAARAHIDAGLIDWEPITWRDTGETEMAYELTLKGLEALEAWDFAEARGDSEGSAS